MNNLSQEEIVKIRRKIINKVHKEIDLAILNDQVDSLLDKYGIEIEDQYDGYIDTRRMSILVLGELSGRKDNYIRVARRQGISGDNIVFINYDEAKHFNAENLRFSTKFSDIIIGAIPHKIEGMGDARSLFTKIQRNPREYPKLLLAKVNNNVRIGINGFAELLCKTRYYEALADQY